MSLSTVVKKISVEELLPLRHRILKPHLKFSECLLPEDNFPTTFHIGIFHYDKLASVATFMIQSHPHFSAGLPYRLRGMATDDKYRGQGFGRLALQSGVNILKQMHGDFLWFNARMSAFEFYERLGFQTTGPVFDITGIGPHKVMYKPLFSR